MTKSIYSHVKDISIYLPEAVLYNEELSRLYPDWTAEKIFEKTGVSQRRICSENQTAADLALEAALRLFSQEKVKVKDIDFVILCTQAPDYVLPTTACLLQDRLGISRDAGALDINLGCSGFVYGLSLAKGLVETGAARCVLLLTSDTYSKFIHPRDKSVRTIFGDGAAATAVVATESEEEQIGPFIFGTDGRGGRNLIVEGGMFRMPNCPETSVEKTDVFGNVRTQNNLYMNGAEVMAFSLREIPAVVTALLKKTCLTLEDVEYLVLHQANKFMLEKIQKKLNVSPNKIPILMRNTGNTVSSSIPIALYQMRQQGLLNVTRRLMLVGFGVGYSWAACLIYFCGRESTFDAPLP